MTTPATGAIATQAANSSADAGATGLAGHAAALQTVLLELSTLTVSHLVALFRQYRDAPEFVALLRQAFPGLVSPYAHAAATVTAQWYDELDPGDGFTATPVVDLPAERIDNTVRWALYAPAAHPKPAAAPDEALVPQEFPREAGAVDADVTLSRLAGATKRMVFDASRDTVLDNTYRQGIRWARYASADACAFCRMMATKPGSKRLYRTEKSAVRVVGRSTDLTLADRRARAAGQASTEELLARRETYERGDRKGQVKVHRQRGSRELGEKYHDHCRCVAVPVRDGETYMPPDYTEQWSQDYRAAVKATKAAGKTKGEYGAIDFKAVLAHMRANTDAH